jgi:glycosyltransferase involved in cell wall biosynthesis
VGRCAPNKRIDDLLNAFAYFQAGVQPESRLIHVGSFAGTERYYYLLLTRVREMGLNNVHFAGAVPQAELNAYYACAHVFLCMSEHEGFCIPLIESMVHDVPVLAYAAGAVPETLDGAGVLFRDKAFDLVSEMMARLSEDSGLRAAVIAGQRNRLERYRARDLAAELAKHLAPLLET